MSSADATPSSNANTASLIMGIRTRLTMNPGTSLAKTGVFPKRFAKSSTSCVVRSDVSNPRTTSTSFITGAGFMKCKPMTRSGRPEAAPNFVIEMDEVLLASTTCGTQIRFNWAKSSCFTAKSSGTASMTICTSRKRSSCPSGRTSANTSPA